MAEPVAHHLGGRYEVRSLVGRGGMAEVHLGFDTRLSRVVAIKMLRLDLARDSVFQARFRREAQSAASLNHPNIVAVYDTGEETVTGADGKAVQVPFIVMEYIEGHTVKDLLADGTPVPISEAIDITSGVLSALEYSHSKGLVHRDIKPGNVMLTNQGKVKVMDFGIARALTDSQATMTQTNAVVGTAQYLSPEQARGEQVDTRSDLYSTGVLLFELLTGRPPFKGDSAVAVAYQHVQQLPPAPSTIASDVPESLDRIVMKALAKNREDRYATASSMKADLIRAAQGVQVNAPATSVWAAAAAASTATAATQAIPAPLPTETTAAPPAPAFHPVQSRTEQLLTAEENDEVDTSSKKKRNAIIATLVIVALLLIGGVVYALSQNDGAQSATVTVPDVTGQSQESAKAAIEAEGLVWKLGEEVASDTVPVGSVVSTNPIGGTPVESGSTVTAHLSSGPGTVTVPANLVGMTADEAKAAIEAAGLVYKLASDQVASEEVEKDKVAKTNPSPGQKVNAGSEVTVYISSGSEKVTVPDVSGLTQDQAREALAAVGLKMGNAETANHPTIAENRIISTQPTAGSEAKKNDTITVIISDGRVTIPTGIVGSAKDTAIAQLNELGLTVNWSEQYSSTVAAGNVISISVTEGSSVRQHSEITMVVSRGRPTGDGGQSS